jgi:hypothetical protein
MEVTCSSEMSVDFQLTTRVYIPEENTVHNHRREDLRSDKENFLWYVTAICCYLEAAADDDDADYT